MRPRHALVVLGTLVGACTTTPAKSPAPAEPPPTPAARVPGLPPLSAREHAMLPDLRRDVTELSQKIGERNAKHKWELASAADWLAGELEKAGYGVVREGYEIDGIAAQNLAVEIKGVHAPDEVVVVGAHYDSAEGSPGANDNATGVAAVLTLARRYRSATPERTLRFVLFVNAESPYFQSDNMGSVLYAKAAIARGEKITAMLSLESLGYFSDAPGSQKFPQQIAGRFPTTANFIAVVGNPESAPLVESIVQSLRGWSSLPIEGASLPEDVPGVGGSDHWAFWRQGIPAAMITDTAFYRDPHFHSAGDTPARLDYSRLARVVAGLESAIAQLVGDAMAPKANRGSGSGPR
jgi:hypothetical protein